MRLVQLLRRPLPIVLQGQNWLALPLRLRDLADIEAITMAQWKPEPLPLGDIEDRDYRDALRAAFATTEGEQPEWGTSQAADFALGTVAGLSMILRGVLREHDLPLETLTALAESLTTEEWSAVFRIAFGTDPASEAYRFVDKLIGVPDRQGGNGTPWPEAIAETAAALGTPPGRLADMTLPELNLFRSGGKVPDPWGSWDEEADPEGWAYFEKEVLPRRSKFWNEGKESATGGDGEIVAGDITGPPGVGAIDHVNAGHAVCDLDDADETAGGEFNERAHGAFIEVRIHQHPD